MTTKTTKLLGNSNGTNRVECTVQQDKKEKQRKTEKKNNTYDKLHSEEAKRKKEITKSEAKQTRNK